MENLSPQSTNPSLIGISELFKNSFPIYKNIFWKYIKMSLVPLIGVVVMILIISFFAITSLIPSVMIQNIAYAILGLLGLADIIFLIYLGLVSEAGKYIIIKSGEVQSSKTIKEYFKESRPYAGKLFFVGLLVMLAILGGLILLIIPGIIFAVYFSFSSWALMDEGFKSTSALKRSRELIKGHFWGVVARIIILGLISFLVSLPALFFKEDSIIAGVYGIITTVFSIAYAPFTSVYAYLLFKNLKELKPATAIAK